MAVTKCPTCGAGILEESGKFCSFCGGLLPDDVHRAELKIENVSDMARLEFEREQARKQEEKEQQEKKKRLIRNIVKILVPVVMALIGYIMNVSGNELVRVLSWYVFIFAGITAFGVFIKIVGDFIQK